MSTLWKKRLFKFSKKLVATLISAALKRAIVLPNGMTEYREVFQEKGLPTSAISQKESSKIKNGGHWCDLW